MEFIKGRLLKQVIVVLLIIGFMFLFADKVGAKTLKELKAELSALESKYSKNQSDKKQTETDIASTKGKIDEITNEKNKVSKEIDGLNEEIKKLGEEIEKMREQLKDIVHYYQISSSNSVYLEYVFNATDFTDFIYRLAVSEQLSEHREKMIAEYNKLMEENKKKINELAEKQTSLSKLEEELSVELSKLDENLSEITEVSVDIKEEIKEVKASINTYTTKYKCSENEDVAVCVNNYNQAQIRARGGSSYTPSGGNISAPSANGFYRPVASGRVNANYGYTAYYGSFHDGMDIGVPHGTPVYSVATGTVMKISYKSSCGGNMVYIGHYTGSGRYTSGYFHLASVNVSVGQVVTPDTVIGYSGGVPGIETWDRCSTGAHLHLQFGTGIFMSDYFYYSNYAARKFDARQLINFPPMGSYFSGR